MAVYMVVVLMALAFFTFFLDTLLRYRYCRMLEEGSFRGRTADFVFMFIFGGTIMTVSFLMGDTYLHSLHV